MEYRRLGRTDLKVSSLCLGTMTFGQQNSEAEGHAQMDYAVAQGINFLDTAELYAIPPSPETQGATERIIGSWFKARGNRDRIILASKICGRGPNTWFRDDGSPTRLTRKQIFEAVDKSLRRLKTDYIDLYQIHFPERPMPWGSNPTRFSKGAYARPADETPIAEQLDAFADVVKAGKIRHLGLSNESAWGTMRFVADSEARGTPRVQSIQNAYNLVNRSFETALGEVALNEDVGLIAYSPLAQGYLTGKYLDGARPAGARTTLFNRAQRYETPGTDEAVRRYVALARESGLDPAQMALAFVDSRPFVTATIIGATTMEQLRTDIASIDVRLAPEVEAGIDAIHQSVGNPCP
ncbi:NADP(H)-dependent aldo-keto reductase [Bosea sp. (in: a-proteobacteria)]|uniref:NADP(H)-dependent aldo-keto reductase n=1 Tax=Bosea sp. (in: a-proteobacteria) TaxID=1871050 RepID=UPI00261CA2CD|nr:NADP(H)-dependent aldo-keto reductase [Bosea sp. (in: a-proteobacteria)]MCO5090536.1 NADP(H)-dependent aldo-keto reductase [Bosea sp. (in: a-proteobacteria)]